MDTTPCMEELLALEKKGLVEKGLINTLKEFFASYTEAAFENGYTMEQIEPIIRQMAKCIAEQIACPYHFEPYHKKIETPFNYYKFGQDFITPLVDLKRSKLFGLPVFDQIQEQLRKGENAILFANHQIEPDPQVISLLLQPTHDAIGKEMIFVAGHRVTTDPVAVPFSLGRNLLCIYSKRHMENPPEEKAGKLEHNQKTLKQLEQLLKEGSHSIYVAPSGGRDRPDQNGNIFPAPFDPDNIELFHLIAKKAKTKTHFYPLALSTYHILKPPSTILKELGEERKAQKSPALMKIGEEIDLAAIDALALPKQEKRALKTKTIFESVNTLYATLQNK